MNTQLSPLDDFLKNPVAYNAKSLVDAIDALLSRSAYLTGGKINVTIADIDHSKSLKDVLKWCAENDEAIVKMNQAVDLMVSGWERGKLMELIENESAKRGLI